MEFYTPSCYDLTSYGVRYHYPGNARPLNQVLQVQFNPPLIVLPAKLYYMLFGEG